MTTVDTVRGPVRVDDRGFTLTHEQVARDQPDTSIMAGRAALRRDIVTELRRVAAWAVRTIVDATALGRGRDGESLAELSEVVDPDIVATATGVYTFDELPKIFHYRHPTAAHPPGWTLSEPSGRRLSRLARHACRSRRARPWGTATVSTSSASSMKKG